MVASIASSKRARRWGAGTAAIARLLIAADRPLTGVAIADTVGVSQPRASQVLRLLRGHDAVRATGAGYVGRRAKLLDLYAQSSRPTLVDHEICWYSIQPMAEQANRVIELSQESGARVAFSADLAPDLLTPWRHPTLTIVYSDKRLLLDTARFVPAEGQGDASLIVRWTSDPTLLSPTEPWPSEIDGVPLTDPVQQWCDLLVLGGNDRREAAERLRRAILTRKIPGAND